MRLSSVMRKLASQLGVTRLARVTGLDRIGIEVVAAIRPTGHILQVTQGKGDSISQAVWSALGETAELFGAETGWRNRVLLRDEGPSIEGYRLTDAQQRVFLPAEAVFCPPWGQGWFGVRRRTWTSNGLAAAFRVNDAIDHAVKELYERDSLARVLPDGWVPDVARERLVRSNDPLIALCERAGCEVFVFDLTSTHTPLPVAGALLFDVNGVVPLTAGYACRETGEQAIHAALLEAAQSRLTEIHGAREDVADSPRERGEAMLEFLRRVRPKRRMRTARPKLRARVNRSITIVEVSQWPLRVVKATSEELLHSALL